MRHKWTVLKDTLVEVDVLRKTGQITSDNLTKNSSEKHFILITVLAIMVSVNCKANLKK